METAKIVFFLESGHIDEIPYQKPLCGKSGINFSDKLYGHKIPFGLWDEKPNTIGIFESCPFPLQRSAYKKYFKDVNYPIDESNEEKITWFSRDTDFIKKDLEAGGIENYDLINHCKPLPKSVHENVDFMSNIFEDYKYRVDHVLNNVHTETIVLCGTVAQRLFNAYMFCNGINVHEIDSYIEKGYKNKNTGIIKMKSKTICLIYTYHPKYWTVDDKNYPYLKSTLLKIKEKISEFK